MKGGFKSSLEWVLGLATAVLIQHMATVTAVYTMSQTCAQYSNGWIADPNDCTSFGYCNNSILQGTARCPEGYVYNTRRAECQPPSAGACSVGNVCEFAADNSVVPNPSDCHTYYFCEKKVGKVYACPDGQIYDSRTTACIWKKETPSNFCAAESMCLLVPDGKFIGDVDNCGQFITCINGVGTPGKCPDGTYYNKEHAACQSTNPCQGPTIAGVGLGVITPLPNNPSVCKNQTIFPSFLSDDATCMGFYVCLSKDGHGQWRKCDDNLHFENGQCRSPCSVKCQYDRCGNMNQEFVAAYGTGCMNYLVCKNQTSQAIGYTNYKGTPCPSDNPFFDEVIQRCVPTSPASSKYTLCP